MGSLSLLAMLALAISVSLVSAQPNPDCATSFENVILGGKTFPQTRLATTWNEAFSLCFTCFNGLADINTDIVFAQYGGVPNEQLWIGSFNIGPREPRLPLLVWFSGTGQIVQVNDSMPRKSICQPPPPPVPVPTPSPPPNCGSNQIKLGNNSFILLPDFYNWVQANATCSTCFGTRLATVFTPQVPALFTGSYLWVGSYQGGPYTPGLLLFTETGNIVIAIDFANPGTSRRAICDIPTSQMTSF